MRIVQIANFYGSSSGGLRTTMHQLASGYREAGHESVLIVPGVASTSTSTPWGTLITIPAMSLPFSGGYRVMTDLDHVCTVLEEIEPDALEVADRLTLRGLGWWARARGVPSTVWAHERIDGVLRAFAPVLPTRLLADLWNRSTHPRFDRVIATTAFAAEEFERIGAVNIFRLPLGVDLDAFHPSNRDYASREALLGPGNDVLLVLCSRLSREKRPDLAMGALRWLRSRGVAARLVVMGSGPLEASMRKAARHLPMTMLGHVSDVRMVSAVMANADVVIAPGPIETFGLAALEAMASGSSVVVSRTSALAELVTGSAGQAVAPSPSAIGEAVLTQLLRPETQRRVAARNRAEQFPWANTVAAMLALHGDLQKSPAR